MRRNATRLPGSKADLAGRISNPVAWTRPAGLALQGLHEFCGAGPGDPLARREFPPRALAEAGRRHDDSTSAGRWPSASRTSLPSASNSRKLASELSASCLISDKIHASSISAFSPAIAASSAIRSRMSGFATVAKCCPSNPDRPCNQQRVRPRGMSSPAQTRGHRFMPRIAQWHVRNSPAWRSVRYGVHYQIISLPPKSSPSFLREPWGQPGRAQGYFPLCGRDYCARMKRWAHLLAPARAGRETGRRQGRPSAIASFDHADRASPAFTSPIASRAARPSSGPGSFAAPQDRTHSIGDQYGRNVPTRDIFRMAWIA